MTAPVAGLNSYRYLVSFSELASWAASTSRLIYEGGAGIRSYEERLLDRHLLQTIAPGGIAAPFALST